LNDGFEEHVMIFQMPPVADLASRGLPALLFVSCSDSKLAAVTACVPSRFPKRG